MKSNKINLIVSDVVRALFGPCFNYRLRYLRLRKHLPNLKNPHDLSERIISAMYYYPGFEKYAIYADKYRVREYIESKGLGSTLLKHYGVWDKPEEIPFESLPEKYILKANNGSGHHYICKDKSKVDKEKAIATLNLSLQNGINHIEPHYRSIEPKVFCEELIDTGTDAFPTDYKFTCVKGEICDIFVAVERAVNAKYITLDTDWNVLPYTRKEFMPNAVPPRPKLLKEMIEIAKILSADFDFVRVDLYEYNNKVYFSELTFSPWGGMMYSYTDEAIKIIGDRFNR